MEQSAMFTNDAVIFGVLSLMLGFIFHTSSKTSGPWVKFYRVCPPLLLCFFLPGLLNTFDLVNPDNSKIYFVASRYLLPASLILLTLSIDLHRIRALGWKAIIMFLTATMSIVIGGPLTIMLVSFFAPEWVGGTAPDEVWRGMAYIAGGWIGGTVNGLAMYETFEVSEKIFPAIAAADLLVAYSWVAVLIFMASHAGTLDRRLGADASIIVSLQETAESFQKQNERIASLRDLMIMLAFAFGAVGVSHFLADRITVPIAEFLPVMSKVGLSKPFLWVIILATAIGITASFSRASELEHAGASRIGMVFIFIVCASVGMNLDLSTLWPNKHIVFVATLWMFIHALLLFIVARLIRAPTFFVAVGSGANIGGPASAALVAAAFHPALMPIGVVLALLGYGLGTYMAYVCGLLMQIVAPIPPY